MTELAEHPFTRSFYQGEALKHIPFFLFFAYKTGDSRDGTITLNSQLESRVHFAALKSYGFNMYCFREIFIVSKESARVLTSSAVFTSGIRASRSPRAI